MFKIGVLISGGGTNLQSLIDAVDRGDLKMEISMVISDRECATGLERASSKGIENCCISRKKYSVDELSTMIMNKMVGVDIIVLAGFLSILQGEILERFKGRIINIHPSLIPRHCGNGMYGDKVHKSVIESGDEVSGCTVHYVDCGTDTGPMIRQKIVEVAEKETVNSLKAKVLEKEHELLVEVLKDIIDKELLI